MNINPRTQTSGFLVLCAPLVLTVFFAFILPYGAAFWNAFKGAEEISVWNNSELLQVVFFTVKQTFFSVLVSLAIGLPGALFLGRGSPRFQPLWRTITAIPFAMPSILVVLGFVLFYGNSGWLNRTFAAIMGTREGPFRILYKPEAIVLAHGFFNFPLVIRLAGDGLARVRKAYAPAAASLGASPFITFFTVILPITIPAFMSAILLVFLYSFTSFAVVLVLGGGPASTTLAVEIYRYARIFHNYPNAGILAIMETTIAISVFLGYIFFLRKSAGIKTEYRDRVFESKKSIPYVVIMILYALFTAFFILGPLLSMAIESLLYRPSRSAGRILTLRWWSSLGSTCLPSLIRSVILAFFSASLACALAVLSAGSIKISEIIDGGGFGKTGSAGVNLVRFFAASPLVSSGIVMGFGWLIIYGRNLSRTPLALVVLHGVIALPFAYNSISEGFRLLPENTINAAIVFGASPLRAMLTTAIPLSIRHIRSAWGFAAAISLGELNAVMMLGIEEWETLPLYIYRAAGAYRYGSACAAGTLLILVCAMCFLLSEWGRKKYAA